MVEALKESGEEITANMSAQDISAILLGEFKDGFVFNGVTGKCEGENKSTITWNEDGTVDKEAVKYVVKEVGGNG